MRGGGRPTAAAAVAAAVFAGGGRMAAGQSVGAEKAIQDFADSPLRAAGVTGSGAGGFARDLGGGFAGSLSFGGNSDGNFVEAGPAAPAAGGIASGFGNFLAEGSGRLGDFSAAGESP